MSNYLAQVRDRSYYLLCFIDILYTGTAAIICPVDRIGYLGEDIPVPTGDDSAGLGPVSRVMLAEITGRQFGTIPSDWSVVVAE